MFAPTSHVCQTPSVHFRGEQAACASLTLNGCGGETTVSPQSAAGLCKLLVQQGPLKMPFCSSGVQGSPRVCPGGCPG